MITTTIYNKESRVHDLLSREIRSIRNWVEWLELWQEARTIEQMVGLLHCGFDTGLGGEPNEIQRVIFYLKVAHGWDDFHYLKKQKEDRGVEYTIYSGDGWKTVSACDARKIVARKAFSMLCNKFFGSKEFQHSKLGTRECHEDWESFLRDNELMQAIKTFFGKENLRPLRNPKSDIEHQTKKAVNFLVNFSRHLMIWEEDRIESWYSDEEVAKVHFRNDTMGPIIESLKLWSLEVLAYLGMLDELNFHDHGLTHEHLEHLTKIALGEEKLYIPHQGGHREVTDLDEACYAGSKTALFVKRIETFISVQNKLLKIEEAERELRKAKEKLAKVTS